MTKFILGSAQFGSKYGINQSHTPKIELEKILKICQKSNIKIIDTALNYSNFKSSITNSKLEKFKFITKLKFSDYDDFRKKEIDVKKNLSHLKKKSFYGILHHNIFDFSTHKIKKQIHLLNSLKKKKLTKKIGVSIYSPKDLIKIKKIKNIDIIQFPLNIFDNRVIKYLNTNKITNVELHARSIFLQGTLLNSYKKNYRFFKSDAKIFEKWEKWCQINTISKLQACINFAMSFKKLDFIVIGFNTSNQLIKFLKCKNNVTSTYPKHFSKQNLKILDPRKWKY